MNPPRAFLLALLAASCAAPDKSTEGRSALGQRLFSAAVERAVAKIPADPFAGRRLFLRVHSPHPYDAALLDGIVRDRLALAGANIAPPDAPAVPDAIDLSITFQAAGTDTEISTLGIPVLSVLSASVGAVGGAGDVSIYTVSAQNGFARIYGRITDRATGRTIAALGPYEGESRYSNLTVLILFGPFRFTDLPDEGELAAPAPAPKRP